MNIVTNNSIKSNYLSWDNYPQGKYSHSYDALNRRISETKDGITTQFIWDGNNLFCEITSEKSTFYVWGLDMSETLQGAGGVGGLLYQYASSAAMQTEQSFPFYDNNGNITMYIKSDYTLGAYYNYDAFLNGCQGDQYRFQASTKSWNPDLGLLEYQFRAYSPELGRWIQEDPIQEQGGINLYNFVNNNPVNYFDFIGLSELSADEYLILTYDRLNDGVESMDRLWQLSMSDYINADPEDDLFCDCQDDVEEIIDAYYQLVSSEKLYEKENKFNHGNGIDIGVHTGDGSSISHFFGGAYMEMMFEFGDTAQDLFERSEVLSLNWDALTSPSPNGGDWMSDTAYAYAGADFADFMHTWFDSNCRKMAEAFANGSVKFTDMLGSNMPENTKSGIKKYRNEFRERLDGYDKKYMSK